MKKHSPSLGCCLLALLGGALPLKAQTLTVQEGLQLWLKADAGVTADGDGVVADWNDQTANANHAAQFDPTFGPKLVANAVNNKPVIRFDGVDDYLEIPDSDSLSITEDLTTFFVVRFADFATYRAVWAKTQNNFPAPVDYYTLPDSGIPRVFRGNGVDGPGNNGFVDALQAMRANTFITTGFEISGTELTHYLAAQPIGGGNITANIADADTSVIIGSRADLFTKMKGDIAEILIYNRALNEVERGSVTGYLGEKYNIQNIPPTVTLAADPAGPVLAAGTTVTLTATPADPDGTVARVQFLANGAPVATATAAPYSVKVTLDSTGSYSFTARVTDDKDGTTTSAATVRTVSGGGDAVLDVLDNLSLWMKADAGVVAWPGDLAAVWEDQSPNHNDAASVDETTAPALVMTDGPNGKPVLRFDGVDDQLTVQDTDSVSFDGDVTSFFVARMDDFVTYRAVWAKTTSNLPASVDYYLLPGSGVPRFFRGAGVGTDLRSIEGAPLRAGVFELAGFSSVGDTMSQYLNGQLNGSSTAAVGKVDMDNPLIIGSREDGVTRMKGDIAEILIYKAGLSPENMGKVQLYLARKYAVPLTSTLNNAPAVVLTAPANGAILTVPADVALTATAEDADGSVAKVEFLVNGTVAATDTTAPYQASVNFPLPGSPQITVRVTDNLGAVTTTAPATITLNSQAASDLPDLANLKFWLKADTAVTQAAGVVSAWDDQSGNLNHAVQGVDAQRPLLVANELNGKPVLRFDGVDDFLSAGSSPTLANTGDITSFFVVRFDDFATYRTVWAKTDVNQPRSTDYYTQPDTGIPLVYRGGATGIQSVLAAGPLPAGEFAVVGFEMGGTAVHHFLNGALNGEGEITSALQDTGRPLLIGQRGDGVTRLKGDVAEIVIYNSALSDADRAQVVNYLGKKYNIPVENISLAFPPLTILSSGNNITVSWPVDATGVLLESSDTMEEGTWVEVPGVAGNTVTQPRSTRNFYRLRRAPVAGQ